jgi:hypothetical protein
MDEKLKLKVPTKHGYVEIEGSHEAVESVLKLLNPKQRRRNGNGSKGNGTSIKSLLFDLIDDGFFDTPKSIGEIRIELQRKGYTLGSNVISPILHRDFLQAGILDREGSRKTYKYMLSKKILQSSTK